MKSMLLVNVVLSGLGLVQALPFQDDAAISSARSIVKRASPYFWYDPNLPGGDKVDRVRSAWIEMLDMVEILYQKEDTEGYTAVTERYFDGANEALGVYAVWQNILGVEDGNYDPSGSDALGHVLLTNQPVEDDKCNDPKVIAFQVNTEVANGPGSLLKICPQGYDFPLISEIKCDDLGDEVGKAMSTLAGVLLHEIVHFDEIGKKSVQKHIQDHEEEGYGPVNVVKNGKGNLFKSYINADNYRWMATEYLWRTKCSKSFNEATSNEDFKKCPEGENGQCTIQ